jgi:hypothetical protein
MQQMLFHVAPILTGTKRRALQLSSQTAEQTLVIGWQQRLGFMVRMT